MKNEPICNSAYCEFAENHYSKLDEHDVLKKVQLQTNTNASYFKKMADLYKVCPYELQMDSIRFVDVIISDYNYVFSPSSNGSRVVAISLGEIEKTKSCNR